MRILFVIPSLRPSSPIRWAVGLITRLSEKFDITVFILDPSSESTLFGLLESKSNINVVFGAGRGPFAFFINFLKLFRMKKGNEFESVMSLLFRADLLVAACNFDSAIVSVRNDILKEYFYEFPYFAAKLFTSVHMWALNTVDICVFMSEKIKDEYQVLLKSQALYIPNGLDCDDVRVRLAPGNATRFYTACAPSFVMVGSLIKRKQVFESVLLFKKLFDEGYTFRLNIVGEGPEAIRIRSFLECYPTFASSVILHGHLSNPIPILEESDVFFMNSECEGISRALMEAALLRKIIIARINPGVLELLSSGEANYLFEGDSQGLVLIRKVCENMDSFRASELPERFTIENCVQEYEELLLSVIDKERV